MGQHIVFDQGQFDTDSSQGMHLLAHELAHTVQQGENSSLQRAGDLTVAPTTDSLEHEADAAADRALRSQTTYIHGRARSIQLQRAQWGPCPEGQHLSGLSATVKQGTQTVVVERPAKGATIAAASKFAELNMMAHYQSQRGTNVVVFDVAGDKDKRISDDPLFLVTWKNFYTGYRGQWPSTKQPDIIDYTLGEVYDVTTVDQTRDKVRKIQASYIAVLNSILDREILGHDAERDSEILEGWKDPRRWKAGQTLEPPNPTFYPLDKAADPSVVICFGPTNLDNGHYPGVLSYEVIRRDQVAPGPGNFSVTALGSSLVFQVSAAPASTTLTGQPAATAIQGLTFKRLERKGRDVLVADFRGGPLNPVSLTDLRFIVQADRKLELAPGTKEKPFEVKYLSKGKLTHLSLEEDGLHGKGTIKPSLPLLKNATADAELAGDHFSFKLGGDPKKITPSIPQLKITQADLGLVVSPELSAGRQSRPRIRTTAESARRGIAQGLRRREWPRRQGPHRRSHPRRREGRRRHHVPEQGALRRIRDHDRSTSHSGCRTSQSLCRLRQVGL